MLPRPCVCRTCSLDCRASEPQAPPEHRQRQCQRAGLHSGGQGTAAVPLLLHSSLRAILTTSRLRCMPCPGTCTWHLQGNGTATVSPTTEAALDGRQSVFDSLHRAPCVPARPPAARPPAGCCPGGRSGSRCQLSGHCQRGGAGVWGGAVPFRLPTATSLILSRPYVAYSATLAVRCPCACIPSLRVNPPLFQAISQGGAQATAVANAFASALSQPGANSQAISQAWAQGLAQSICNNWQNAASAIAQAFWCGAVGCVACVAPMLAPIQRPTAHLASTAAAPPLPPGAAPRPRPWQPRPLRRCLPPADSAATKRHRLVWCCRPAAWLY